MPFKANSNLELQNAVDAWTDGTIDAGTLLSTFGLPGPENSTTNQVGDTFGAMNTWDVSAVTSMSSLFQDKTNFNEDIGDWDVSAVTTMERMFYGATAFNQYIGQWDVSAVTNMSYMFLEASAFNNGGGNAPLVWNVRELVDAHGMFRNANSFNQKLNWTNTELKLEDVSYMFYFNQKFNQNVNVLFKQGNKINNMRAMFESANQWNNGGTKNVKDDDNVIEWYTDNVTDMNSLFRFSEFNQRINIQGGVAFNTWKVTDMSYMFSELPEFNEPLGFMNTGAVTDMGGMFYNSKKFNDGNTLGMGGWNVSKVTNFGLMFANASAFRGKVNTWDVKSDANFDLMFSKSGLVNDDDTPKDDIFKQDFRKTPTAEKFGYKFLEKEAGLITWDNATGRATGAYNIGVCDLAVRITTGSTGIGAATPFTTPSGNQMFNLDDPFNIGFYLRSGGGLGDTYPSYWGAAVAFTLSVKTGETAVGMNVYDPTNNTSEGNKKLIEKLVGFIDIDDPVEQYRFGRKRFMYYEEGIFKPTKDIPFIAYITLEKDNEGNYTKWTTKTANSASELLAKGYYEDPVPADLIYDEYIVIDENSTYTPTTQESDIPVLPLCAVPHTYTTEQATQLLFTPGSPFGTWLIATYQPTAEYRSVLSTTISANYPTGNLADPVVVEYIQHLIDRHVVTIDGTKVLIDNNNELYDVTTGQKLGTTYSGTYYNSNMVSDLKKPLDRLRLIAHIDFSPQVAGIYDALVPFCEKNSDGNNVKNYKKLYPSDLQQLYSSYYSDAGVVNKSFACGSPNFPGLSTQAAEDDADLYFDVLRGVFSGNYNTVKGQYVTRNLISGFQDLRLVYFERGFYNPILDVNGNEVQPGDASYGTVYKPYVSYIHFIDGQTLVKKKQTVDSTDGLYGLYAFIKQLPLTSFIEEYTYTTGANANRSPDQTKTNTKLKTMVDTWYQKANDGTPNAVENANKEYGPPKYWITEKVTNMDNLFANKTGPNHPDIDYWNMYNVKSSKTMFASSSFNGELANWERYFPEVDASGKRSTMQNNTDMSLMFAGASEFNQDIGGWDVDGALNMQGMFYDAQKFDQSNLCKWAPADENVNLTDMFGYNTTQTPMYKNGPSYGFTVPKPLYEEFGNCAPKFTSTPVTSAKVGDKYTYTATVTDLDTGDIVTMTATKKPDWLSFAAAPANGASYVLSGTPPSSAVGNNSVELTATDGTRSSIQSFTIVVSAADNNSPVFTSVPVTFAVQDTPYNAPDGYKVTATDSDGDAVTIVANTIPSWATYSGGVLSGTPANKDVGTYPVKFTATDGKGGEAVQEFTITVQNVNDAPVFTSKPPTTARQESLYSYKVTTSDPDVGDVVTVTTPIKPDWLSFNPTTNTLSGTPPKTVWGNVKVRLRASDGGLDTHQEFTIMVKKPICFNQGTKILCFKNGKEQYVSVEQLREGDQVKTLKHGYKKIIDMRKGTFKLNGLMDMGMYRMKKQGNMIADLEMTGLHAMLVDKDDAKYADDIKRQRGLNNKKFFIDGKFRLRANQSHEFQQMKQKEYTIYSFALEEQQQQYGIWANGLLVETTRRKMLEVSSMERVRALEKSKSQ